MHSALTRLVLAGILVSLGTQTATAANLYIRDGATGSTCADWSTNACDQVPAMSAVTRGDTIYVAAGTYTGVTFDKAVSGTTLITIKKATVADHGTSTGWSDAYATGAAAWGNLIFDTSYWTFDGVSGGGPGAWTSGHGFTFNNTACAQADNFIAVTTGVSTITLRHIDFSQTGNVDVCSPATLSTSAIYNSDVLTNATFEYLYIHNISGLPFFLRYGSGNILQFNYLGHVCGQYISDVIQHCEDVVIWDMNDVHFRYNYLSESPSSGGFVHNGTGDGTSDSIRIYGNVFRNGGPIVCNSGTCTNWRIFNNTFMTNALGPVSGNGVFGASNYVDNNIIFGADFSAHLLGSTHDYNYYSQVAVIQCVMESTAHENICVACSGGCDTVSELTDPFVSSGGTTPEALRLSGAITGQAGIDVCTLDACTGAKTYNTDAFGVTRGSDGVWDRGAYELNTARRWWLRVHLPGED